MSCQYFALFLLFTTVGIHSSDAQCSDQCVVTIVESIPDNLTYTAGSPEFPSTFSGWSNLLDIAQSSIHIASYYWTLRYTYNGQVVPNPLDDEGEAIFNGLMDAGLNRGIEILIAQNEPDAYDPDIDSQELAAQGAAQVRSLNFDYLLGAGILHTKFWIVDMQHVYIGSANLDWESLTQVKELGLMIYNCSCLAQDLDKVFQIYWLLGASNETSIPPSFPAEDETQYNQTNPFSLLLNDSQSLVYFGSSPPEMCTPQRTQDLDALFNVMDSAQEFVYISVMDYYPLTIYTPKYEFWPDIDNKIRSVAIDKGVKVRMLISHWNHSHHDLAYYLNSLQVITNTFDNVDVQVRIFVVPAFTEIQSKIEYGRVNHAKYMVTDNAVYIGTSNWSGDYFINTGGVSIVVNQTNPNDPSAVQPIREQVQSIFERDWNSDYVHPVTDFL